MQKEVFENSDIAKQMANYRFPRYEELVDFDVFMTQLMKILDKELSIFSVPGEEKILTPSMINNYVFKHIIAPPEHKKYSKTHIIHLLIISIFKQVLSISDIAKIIEMQVKQYPIDVAYNYVITELEKALKVTFEKRDFSIIEETQPTKVTPLTKITRSVIIAFVNQIYAKKSIYYETELKNKL